MEKLWAGRTDGNMDKFADEFNSSIGFDKRLYRHDITGSIAHAKMLGRQGIISKEDCELIIEGLSGILKDIEEGTLAIDSTAEDIHMFVEAVLTERIGDAGKRLHTARSRNDQVALDMKMYIREECGEIISLLSELIETTADKAAEYKTAIMPGYTHLQRAQPVNFAHHLLAYCQMLLRDISRFEDTRRRLNVSPIGSCALAGTTYDTDREYEAKLLSFDTIALNSMDGVSDRDFVVEMLADISLVMVHLSRFAEEMILWSSWEFRFVELSDDFTTGSSIMPQKKNPDMAELVRGKTGRVFGDLMGMLTVLKGLPLAYNKDMQEDKEGVFDAIDTVIMCIKIFTGMVGTMKVREDNMLAAAKHGFINATDLADYLVKKGLPFRSAYKISGEIVTWCMDSGHVLENVPLEEYKKYSDLFDEDVYEAVDLKTCVEKRISAGGPGERSIDRQLEHIKDSLMCFK